jgi:hypothetical protein
MYQDTQLTHPGCFVTFFCSGLRPNETNDPLRLFLGEGNLSVVVHADDVHFRAFLLQQFGVIYRHGRRWGRRPGQEWKGCLGRRPPLTLAEPPRLLSADFRAR